MNVPLILNILLIYVKYISTESTKSTTSQITTDKNPAKETPDITQSSNTNLNSLWMYRPISHLSQLSDEFEPTRIILRGPHFLTKLAKTYRFGFDPYFSKGYFEPFEKRPRPVTLVAFRKNGMVPKRIQKYPDNKSYEIAELQSPYNHISTFWNDEIAEVDS